MDFKRIFRGPIVYILIAIVAVVIGSSLLSGTGFKEVSVKHGLELLSNGTVTSAKIVQPFDSTVVTSADSEVANR